MLRRTLCAYQRHVMLPFCDVVFYCDKIPQKDVANHFLFHCLLACQIAKFLEQRSHKELRSSHVNLVRIITEAYSKLLFICKEQM